MFDFWFKPTQSRFKIAVILLSLIVAFYSQILAGIIFVAGLVIETVYEIKNSK